MTRDLPRVTTREHAWFSAICTRLDTQNRLLRDILDRLPAAPVRASAEGRVELREPKPAATLPEQQATAEPPKVAGRAAQRKSRRKET